MKVTVIIPTFRPGRYLYECLDSLIRQTIDQSELEILLVLNGERVPYYDEITAYLGQTSAPIRLLYVSQPGVSRARNCALEEAKAPQIMFIDDDDVVSPEYVETLLSLASSNVIVASDVRTFSDESSGVGCDYISRAYARCIGRKTYSLFSHRSFMSSACAKLIPKSVVGTNRFPEALAVGEDSLFMFSISSRVCRIVLADNRAIYFRRLRPKSASRRSYSISQNASIFIRSIVLFCEYYYKMGPKRNLPFFITRIGATAFMFICRLSRKTTSC